MMMLLSFVIVVTIILSVNGYYHNHCCRSNRIMHCHGQKLKSGVWPPEIIEDIIKHVAKAETNFTNESSETILITTLSGALASWFISHEFTSVMIGTILANSLAERRDAIGTTTRTFGTKIKELKNELDRILASNKKIVKTPHRFESNKAGLRDPMFWKEAYSAVSYTLGNDLEARQKHYLMLKQIVEEEEKIILKQKIENEIVDAKKDAEINIVNYKKDVEKESWKPKLNFASINLDAVFKGVSSKIGTVQQQSISTIDEWKRIELASSSSSTNDFPQQVSSMSYNLKQKGRMQLAAISTSGFPDVSYSDYDNRIQSNDVEEVHSTVSDLNIVPVITENVSESEYSLHNPITEDDNVVKIAEEKVETIESENTFSIIDNVSETNSSPLVDDRFNQESDLERFRNWGVGIEWNKVKLAGSNLYYHIQKDKISPTEEKFTSRWTKSITPKPLDRSSSDFVRDVLQKATLKSSTYKYYRGLVDK